MIPKRFLNKPYHFNFARKHKVTVNLHRPWLSFDALNHGKFFLQKIIHYGIRGISNDWFRSYPGLDRNKLAQVQNIAHHFYLCSFRCLMNSSLERIFLGVCYKNCISWDIAICAHMHKSVKTCDKSHAQMKLLPTHFYYIIVCVWKRYLVLLNVLQTTFLLISLL